LTDELDPSREREIEQERVMDPIDVVNPIAYVCCPSVQISTTWFANALPSFVA
jgi:hypothetical protein